MAKGLLVDYRWCTGCHTCEVACRKEHGLPEGEFGIKIAEFIWPRNATGDWQEDDTWQYTYLPVPLDACDLCADRCSKGKPPTCVQHCQAQCLVYGDVDDLKERLVEHPKQTLFYL